MLKGSSSMDFMQNLKLTQNWLNYFALIWKLWKQR